MGEPTHHCTAEELLSACQRFTAWLDRVGYASYDPYDIWGTRYGLRARKLYYARNPLGTLLVAPLVLLEIVWPSSRQLFVEKQRYATADAQLVLAFLNLFRVTGEAHFRDRAVALGDEILGYAIKGYRGLCWGYPFDWQNGPGAVWARSTPYITCTPYCYEAFLALHEATGQERYRQIAASIAEFVCHDLHETPTSPAAAAGSYSPKDRSMVINASAYRAFVLLDAARRFGREDYAAAGGRNLAFILEGQREDGAWLYALDRAPSFIDHFHTCFVLKNLIKANRLLDRADVRESIARGFRYYRENLFYPDGNPKSFSIEPRFQVGRLEMYNFAECITLCSLLGDELPGARETGLRLATRLLGDFQLPAGHFVTRVFRFGVRHTFPFLRWPQAQLFYSITSLLRRMAQPAATDCSGATAAAARPA